MAHKFEIYKDKAGEFRVRFKYNSEVIFSTEGYSSKQSAHHAIESIKTNGPGAEVIDSTSSAPAKVTKPKKVSKLAGLAALEQTAAHAAEAEESIERELEAISLEEAALARRKMKLQKEQIKAMRARARADAELEIAREKQ